MHAIAQEGCTDTVREPAMKVDSWREKKIPSRTGESNLLQRRAGPTFYQMIKHLLWLRHSLENWHLTRRISVGTRKEGARGRESGCNHSLCAVINCSRDATSFATLKASKSGILPPNLEVGGRMPEPDAWSAVEMDWSIAACSVTKARITVKATPIFRRVRKDYHSMGLTSTAISSG